MRDLTFPTAPLAGLVGSKAAAATRDAGKSGLVTTAAVHATPDAAAGRLEARWAASESEVRAAQRLRHDVFIEEMGARPALPPGTPHGHDADMFDPFCEHLLVWDMARNSSSQHPRVVGTYRVLTPTAARRVGGLYSESEFDLTRLRPLRPTMIEIGRSCVHRDYRSGAVILLLWAALAEFMADNRFDSMIGCASIGMHDGGHAAASLWTTLSQTHMASIDLHVLPRLPLPVDQLRTDLTIEPPPLIKGYLRCGAKLLGPPAWDPDFNTADLPMFVRHSDLPARYRRQFAGAR